MKRLLVFLFFIVSTGIPQAFADEISLRNDMQMEIANLFWKRDFAQLDEKAKFFREDQTRTPSGIWKLTLFYRSLDNLISPSAASDQDWESVFRISDEWAKSSPDSPAAQMSKAIFLIKYAEKIRGTDWAENVPKEAWAPFFEVLKKHRIIF